MSKSVVLGGLGVVGSALVKMLRKTGTVHVIDVCTNTTKGSYYDFLHAAIPYSENFAKIVLNTAVNVNAKNIIVHSTVPVGVTRQIGPTAVHSPVRGQHSNILKGLKTFVKYIGAQNDKSEKIAYKHLKQAGFLVEVMESPEATELSKLFCLSRYLNDLAFYETAMGICKWLHVDEKCIQRWTKTYNEGYMGTKYVRPDLDFPNGKVGGTCVMPVSRMLQEQTKDRWLLKNIDLFSQQM